MAANVVIATVALMSAIAMAVLSGVGGIGSSRPPPPLSVSGPSDLSRHPAPNLATEHPPGELRDLKPKSLDDLLAIPPEDLRRVELLRMNLLCAEGLPGSEGIDIDAYSRRLGVFAVVALADTNRHLYRAADPRYAAHYRRSETYLRCEFLAQTLAEEFGVKYNMDRFWDPDFSDSRDQFLHGLIDPEHYGGTCVSIPVLIAAAGRRLGYPIKLVLAREHVFARWDGPGDGGEPMRLNMEASGFGLGFDSYVDEYYRLGPGPPISDEDMMHREFLVSLTPAEELSVFLAARGHCLYDNGLHEQAIEAYGLAARYAPTFRTYDYFIRLTEATIAGELEAFWLAETARRTPEPPRLTPEEASAYHWKPE